MTETSHGTAHERHIRELAARLGVADFVYAAPPVSKGAAFREASGDGLLVVGTSGAVLQVKARAPDRRDVDTPERAEAWLRKNADTARRQGYGTRRELQRRRRVGDPVTVMPVRAAGLPDGTREKYALAVDLDVEAWPVIVVLDHPQSKGLDLGFEPDVLWITSADWAQLHRRLRSVSATLDYARRVLSDGTHVPLGHESERYRAYRAADERVAAAGDGSTAPFLAHPDDFDEVGADLFHDIIEKVWPDDGVVPWREASEYRRIVEFLDSVPPQLQADLGWWFFRKRGEIEDGHRRSSGIVRLGRRDRLVYWCSHLRHWRRDEDWRSAVAALAMVRHLHGLESGAPHDSVTLAVGAIVEDRHPTRGVAYNFTLIQGEHVLDGFPPAARVRVELEYGVFDQVKGTLRELRVDRKRSCPCGSGRKFKRCCGA